MGAGFLWNSSTNPSVFSRGFLNGSVGFRALWNGQAMGEQNEGVGHNPANLPEVRLSSYLAINKNR